MESSAPHWSVVYPLVTDSPCWTHSRTCPHCADSTELVQREVRSWTSSSMASCSVLSWSRTCRRVTSSELRSGGQRADRWWGLQAPTGILSLHAVFMCLAGGDYLGWPGWETWSEQSGPWGWSSEGPFAPGVFSELDCDQLRPERTRQGVR